MSINILLCSNYTNTEIVQFLQGLFNNVQVLPFDELKQKIQERCNKNIDIVILNLNNCKMEDLSIIYDIKNKCNKIIIIVVLEKCLCTYDLTAFLNGASMVIHKNNNYLDILKNSIYTWYNIILKNKELNFMLNNG